METALTKSQIALSQLSNLFAPLYWDTFDPVSSEWPEITRHSTFYSPWIPHAWNQSSLDRWKSPSSSLTTKHDSPLPISISLPSVRLLPTPLPPLILRKLPQLRTCAPLTSSIDQSLTDSFPPRFPGPFTPLSAAKCLFTLNYNKYGYNTVVKSKTMSLPRQENKNDKVLEISSQFGNLL